MTTHTTGTTVKSHFIDTVGVNAIQKSLFLTNICFVFLCSGVKLLNKAMFPPHYCSLCTASGTQSPWALASISLAPPPPRWRWRATRGEGLVNDEGPSLANHSLFFPPFSWMMSRCQSEHLLIQSSCLLNTVYIVCIYVHGIQQPKRRVKTRSPFSAEWLSNL